ncbi:MAG: hypothetical protein EOP48_25890 [Sphingobacteriales bacterium]|nr:MAG: hypothetical protein EOP48_25890 [Sphingobacteriales bacterium]
MKLEITKACADSLRIFTQNNYGIQLKPTHAHEIVAAYFGYSSRAALIADKECPIGTLRDAELIILNHPMQRLEQRLKTLANLPSGLPSSDVLAATIYETITKTEKLSKNVWTDLKEMAIAYAEDRVFHNEKMMRMIGIDSGFDQRELDWLIQVDIKTMGTDILMTVTYNYPAKAKKPMRHASVAVTLPRIAGNIGYGEPKVLPTFYNGHISDQTSD